MATATTCNMSTAQYGDAPAAPAPPAIQPQAAQAAPANPPLPPSQSLAAQAAPANPPLPLATPAAQPNQSSHWLQEEGTMY